MSSFKILFLIIPVVIMNCKTREQMVKIDTTTVKNVDINRYLGKWYEIARFPHSFEEDLVGVTATYNLDYFFLELDEGNYQYALVGSSSDKYLWILCRTPEMPEETYEMLVSKAMDRGYDTIKLIDVEQIAAQK